MGRKTLVRRAWFRFSLSTCLILVFAAGTLIGANMIDRPTQVFLGSGSHGNKYNPSEKIDLYCEGLGQGWPFIFARWSGWDNPSVDYRYAALAANIAIAAVGLFALGRLIEWRKAR